MTNLAALLDALMAAPHDERPAIERQIREGHLRQKAVLALDMSGFTLSVRRNGILPYLCQIRRMQKLTQPIVHSSGGEVVKYEADNLLAVFDRPVQAVEAAMAMHDMAATPADQGPALSFSIGIDYGDLLMITGKDCFGDPVNLAHKLGEDVANPGELLITGHVRESLADDARFDFRSVELSMSGVDLVAYHVTKVASGT